MEGSGWHRWVALGALLAALLSLALNVYLLQQLRHPEALVAAAAAGTLDRLRGRDLRIPYQVTVPAGTPLRLDVPVDERVLIGVDTLLPLRTRVRIPLRFPTGTRSVTVPIRADIPLRANVPLTIRHTFRLRTRTREPLSIPLEIRFDELPVDSILESINRTPP